MTMTRGMRLLILLFVFVAVIAGMMDCAKKTMKKKKLHQEEGESGWLLPRTPGLGVHKAS